MGKINNKTSVEGGLETYNQADITGAGTCSIEGFRS